MRDIPETGYEYLAHHILVVKNQVRGYKLSDHEIFRLIIETERLLSELRAIAAERRGKTLTSEDFVAEVVYRFDNIEKGIRARSNALSKDQYKAIALSVYKATETIDHCYKIKLANEAAEE